MRRPAGIVVAALAYIAFAAFIGYFSASPDYRYASPAMATVKLSLSHAADRVVPCVRLTPEEVAKLAPNMRRTERCERERLPLGVELEVDGDVIVSVEAPPSGLWNDGPASVYERREIPAGNHRITARLRDTARADGWDYSHSENVQLEPGRYFTITFRAETGGFSFR